MKSTNSTILIGEYFSETVVFIKVCSFFREVFFHEIVWNYLLHFFVDVLIKVSFWKLAIYNLKYKIIYLWIIVWIVNSILCVLIHIVRKNVIHRNIRFIAFYKCKVLLKINFLSFKDFQFSYCRLFPIT